MQILAPGLSARLPVVRNSPPKHSSNLRVNASEGSINPGIEKDSPKVATMVKTSEMGKKVRCAPDGKICLNQDLPYIYCSISILALAAPNRFLLYAVIAIP